MKKVLISVMMLVLCISLFAGCSKISTLNAEDGSVQKEMSQNEELNDEIEDFFADTGLEGEYSVKNNVITFNLDMSNFTTVEDKKIDEKEEKKIVELCERSFSNDHEFDSVIEDLEEYYNIKDVTLVMELKHKGKVLWSKEYTHKSK